MKSRRGTTPAVPHSSYQGAGVQRRPLFLLARAQEEERGREGFEPRRFRRAPGGSAHSRSPKDILP